jgi:hypothetical protein
LKIPLCEPDFQRRNSLEDLHLDRLDVIHARAHFPLAKNVRAIAMCHLLDQVQPLA